MYTEYSTYTVHCMNIMNRICYCYSATGDWQCGQQAMEGSIFALKIQEAFVAYQIQNDNNNIKDQ